VLLARLFAAAARHLRGFLAQVGDQATHRFRVGPEIVGAHVQFGLQGRHCALSAAKGSLGQRRNRRFYHESRTPPTRRVGRRRHVPFPPRASRRCPYSASIRRRDAPTRAD